jgi:hypothetical protein
MNRRDFVVHSTAAVASIGIAQRAVASIPELSAAVRAPRPFRVVFDKRFEPCRAFAAGAARLRCPVRPIAGDVTALWFDELQPSWARGEGTLVGITNDKALFCLEQLAWDDWMRVRARIEHRFKPDGTVRHRLFMPRSALQSAAMALAGDEKWPERLAVPLATALRVDGREPAAEWTVVTRGPARGASQLSLVSWVIAPSPVRDTSL